MGPGRGRGRKKRRKLLDIKSKDIISSLPDEVLGRILSLLPTKYAVATCVLSTRWTNLYQLSGTLDFDDSMSYNPKVSLSSADRIASFGNFVSKVLEQCQRSQISKFRLKCGNKVGYSLVSEWLNAVFLHKVTVLELSVEMVTPYVLQLPHSISQNLVELKLDCNFIFRATKFVSFPSLKVLFFKEVTFPGDSSVVFPSNGEFRLDGLNGILCGCPLLEELAIIGCDWNGSDLFFCNPLLKKLTLDVGLRGALDQLDGSSIYFNVPSLVYLKYNESLAEQYVIKNLNSVVDAHFEVGFNDDDYEDTQDLCNTMLDLIVGVSNCEFLYLSRHCLEALASGEFELPVFKNLTRLKLCQGNDISWNDVLLDFLDVSPGLEALTLVQGCDGELDGDFSLNDNPIPLCVVSRLKVITLENFTGFRGEMEMVKYFLENAAVLEEMVIHWKKRIEAREKVILNFPKASKTCSIALK